MLDAGLQVVGLRHRLGYWLDEISAQNSDFAQGRLTADQAAQVVGGGLLLGATASHVVGSAETVRLAFVGGGPAVLNQAVTNARTAALATAGANLSLNGTIAASQNNAGSVLGKEGGGGSANVGPMAGRRLGHTFTKHGMGNTDNLVKEARGSGKPVGQWLDDAAAERFIADHVDELSHGTITVDLPPGLGRVVNPDGTFTAATRARLVPSGNGVKTAYPVLE